MEKVNDASIKTFWFVYYILTMSNEVFCFFLSPFFFFKPRIAAVECQVQTPTKAKNLSFGEEMNISLCVSRDKVVVTAIVLHHIKLRQKNIHVLTKVVAFPRLSIYQLLSEMNRTNRMKF